MKKITAFLIALLLVLTALAACKEETGTPTDTDTDTSAEPSGTENTTDTQSSPYEGLISEGALQYGTYTGSSTYETVYNDKPFSMTFTFNLTFSDDGTFVLKDFDGTVKGEGTYSLANGVYTLDYGSEKTTDFIIRADGTLLFTSTVYYGSGTISLDAVDDVILSYDGSGDQPTEGGDQPTEGGTTDTPTDATFTLAEGTYTGSFTNATAMGDFAYTYTAVVGADNSFSYSVTFTTPFDEEGAPANEGLSLSGTYTLDGNDFLFRTTLNDEEKLFEGTLTADNVLVVGLQATTQASRIDSITLTAPAPFTLAEGTYTGSFTNATAMGDFVYTYTAVVGADNSFSYSVTYTTPFDEEGAPANEGLSLSGTYTLDGNDFLFRTTLNDEEKLFEGTLTADNVLVVGLQATTQTSRIDSITLTAPAPFTLAEGTYTGSFTNATAMGDFVYTYTAVVGADNSFSYSVTFTTPFDEEGAPANEGLSLSGTYTLDGNDFLFRTTLNDEEKLFEGTLTADNVLVVGLQATTQASRIDSITLTAAL